MNLTFLSRAVLFPIVLVLSHLLISGCASDKKAEARRAHEKEIAEDGLTIAERRKARADREAEFAKQVAAEKQKTQEFRREAGTRNAEKIKSLGFSPSFLRSTIYANALGHWGEFMPVTRWLGLLLENKTISSISAFTDNGNPGVLIKSKGAPALGIVFRLELGDEAYPFALRGNGRTGVISPSEQMEVTFLMGKFTRDSFKQ